MDASSARRLDEFKPALNLYQRAFALQQQMNASIAIAALMRCDGHRSARQRLVAVPAARLILKQASEKSLPAHSPPHWRVRSSRSEPLRVWPAGFLFFATAGPSTQNCRASVRPADARACCSPDPVPSGAAHRKRSRLRIWPFSCSMSRPRAQACGTALMASEPISPSFSTPII